MTLLLIECSKKCYLNSSFLSMHIYILDNTLLSSEWLICYVYFVLFYNPPLDDSTKWLQLYILGSISLSYCLGGISVSEYFNKKTISCNLRISSFITFTNSWLNTSDSIKTQLGNNGFSSLHNITAFLKILSCKGTKVKNKSLSSLCFKSIKSLYIISSLTPDNH